MLQNRFPRSSALLALSVGILFAQSVAKANNITYNIINYPSVQQDYQTPGFTDTISGSIVTNGTMGSLGPSDILSCTLTLQTPTGTYTTENMILMYSFTLTATDAGLYLPSTWAHLQFDSLPYSLSHSSPRPPLLSFQWAGGLAVGYFYFDAIYSIDSTTESSWTGVNWQGTPSPTGNTWLIATPAPEPGTFALLVVALAGFASLRLWRRQQPKTC